MTDRRTPDSQPLVADSGKRRGPESSAGIRAVDTASNIANVERLHALMDRDGLSAVALRSGTNFTYLAGFDYAGTLARHLDFSDSPRGVMIVWPRSGSPVLVLNRFAVDRARRDSWIDDIVVFDDYGESLYERVSRVLHDLGLSSERVGFEKTVVSAADWMVLESALPAAEIADCAPMMEEVRWIKTPGEVERIREAARILDEVYLDVFPTARAGERECDLHARLVAGCLVRGANWAHGILNSNRNTVIYGGEGAFEFRTGDVIRNDYVMWCRGYPGHQSRTVVIGEPSRDLLRRYETVRDIYRATVAEARPGVRACDVHRFAQEAFARAGLDGRVAIAGHSVGAWWHQQAPYLVPACDTPIEAGMVLAFEPHVNEFHLQDMYLIRDDGQENLSPLFSTDAPLVVG